MKLTITITLDNEAFSPDWEPEVARILARLGKELDCMSSGVRHGLRDINGNTVGSVTIEE